MNTDHAFPCKIMELVSSPNTFYFEFCRKAMPKELTNTQEIITSGEKFVVTMTPYEAKSMLVMLDQAVMKYEASFGSLKCPIDNVDKTEDGNGGQPRYPPYNWIEWWATTLPTLQLDRMVGNKKTLPTLHFYR